MVTAVDWSRAYARQALADFETFGRLQSQKIPDCHKLQFLQMACEKLAKAHLCSNKSDPAALQSSHAYIAKVLPVVLREHARTIRFQGEAAQAALKHAKHLAQEIELLAPAVRRGGQRPDNCEYPWEDSVDSIHVPCDWQFETSKLLLQRNGHTVLKLIAGAIRQFLA